LISEYRWDEVIGRKSYKMTFPRKREELETFEHASARTDVQQITLEGIAA
jgi:hypothetical protein